MLETCATIGKENKSSSTEIHPVVFDGLQTDRSAHDRKNAQSKWKDSVDTEQVSKDSKTMTVKQANAVRIYDKKFNVTAADR